MMLPLENKQKEFIESRLIGIDFEIRNTIGDSDYLHALLRTKRKLEQILKVGYIEL